METKANWRESWVMVLGILLVVLSVWAVIGTFHAVRVDGQRQIPTARIVRAAESRR